jgi:hypothetical protein
MFHFQLHGREAVNTTMVKRWIATFRRLGKVEIAAVYDTEAEETIFSDPVELGSVLAGT